VQSSIQGTKYNAGQNAADAGDALYPAVNQV
jgi:hypothetical protein